MTTFIATRTRNVRLGAPIAQFCELNAHLHEIARECTQKGHWDGWIYSPRSPSTPCDIPCICRAEDVAFTETWIPDHEVRVGDELHKYRGGQNDLAETELVEGPHIVTRIVLSNRDGFNRVDGVLTRDPNKATPYEWLVRRPVEPTQIVEPIKFDPDPEPDPRVVELAGRAGSFMRMHDTGSSAPLDQDEREAWSTLLRHKVKASRRKDEARKLSILVQLDED